jgi:O-antigen/teichoic acid export membrane protein
VNSLADQALAVGSVFLANVALARSRTKEEYGMFALSYSIFTFVAGLHNALILEPYTVYGSGRYRNRCSSYLGLMLRMNFSFGFVLSGIILSLCLLMWVATPRIDFRPLVGLGLTLTMLLSGVFLRRSFYVLGRSELAAKSSLSFFLTVVVGLWIAGKTHLLNSFWVFLILGLGWVVAASLYGRKLPLTSSQTPFLQSEPEYWGVHWKYARWVFITAFVFQLMTQGYYWLLAGFLSTKEVGELRAMYNFIAPVDQVFIAIGYLVLPAMAGYYSRNRMDRLLSLWKRYALGVLGMALCFALVLRLLGQRMLHLLYAGRFDGLASLLFVLALLPIAMALGNTMTQALNAVEQPKFVFFGFLSSAVATMVAGIPLVIHFGLRGAVYGMLASGVTFSIAIAIGFFLAVHKRSQENADLPLRSAAT